MRKIIKRNIEYAGSSSLKYLRGDVEIKDYRRYSKFKEEKLKFLNEYEKENP